MNRGGSSPTRMCCSATWPRAPKPGMTHGSRSRCRSWRACSTCRPSSGRSSCSGMCSASRRPQLAGILGTTPAAVNSALIRARAGLRPGTGPARRAPATDRPAEAAAVERFVDAFERFDLGPAGGPADRGRQARHAARARRVPRAPGDRRVPPGAHLVGPGTQDSSPPGPTTSQPSSSTTLPDPCAPIWRAGSLVVLTLRGEPGLRAHPLRRTTASSPASGSPARCPEIDPHRRRRTCGCRELCYLMRPGHIHGSGAGGGAGRRRTPDPHLLSPLRSGRPVGRGQCGQAVQAFGPARAVGPA